MKQNNLWKFLLVVFVIGWSFLQMNPLVGPNLASVFKEQAHRRDAAFTNIVARLDKLQAERTNHTAFANLVEAVGTNSITNYFGYNVSGERNQTLAILNRLQQENAGKIKLGLDLQGGSAFVMRMDTNSFGSETNADAAQSKKDFALSQALEVLRRRVDRFGVAEPTLVAEGNDRIRIQLPGLSEEDRTNAVSALQKAAYLEFRIAYSVEASAAMIHDGAIPPGFEVMTQESTGRDGKQYLTQFVVKKKPEQGLTGAHVKGAYPMRNPVGQPEVTLNFDSEGAKIFGDITTEHVHENLAIVLDGQLQSAPTIREPILGGSCSISGSFTDKEASSLASALENPLQSPLKLESEKSVEPTLGAATVKSGVRSAIIGTLAVAAFMAIYYMFAGIVADIALITNIILLLGVMCSDVITKGGITLTLPGIAGVVLTIGMAVDANVLIFERIREETAKGKSLRGALAAGYDRAFGTIFDSHVTTLISSIILAYLGTGTIKGFGITLTIGVAASLFTALVVTRLIFDFLIVRGWLKSLPMLHVIKATKLDFMKLAGPAFIISWSIIIIGIGYGVFVRGHQVFGTDFVGGDNITLSFSQKIDSDVLSKALKEAKVTEPIIQYQKDLATGSELLEVTVPFGSTEAAVSLLQKDFPAAKFVQKGVEKIGPSIGEEIRKTAIIASIISLFGILLYVAFRYEFSFAVGAVVAVIHDVLMTIGCYCLTGLLGSDHARQFNATTVAALLTIIGFSINDTIVIFDRIREDLKLGVRGSFKDLINQALNQTLSRTIITSGTVFIATMSLYLFGGGAINDFAFTFLVGIITGTYSSIYIASALVLWWHKGKRPATSTQVAVENLASTRA